jgi:putative membrane protein
MKNIKWQFNFVLIAGMLAFASCNNDDTDPTGIGSTADGRETMEEDFVTDVLDMNAKEIAWLNAGISKGVDNELKSEAKKMLSDHEALRSELKEYAQKNHIELPNTDTSGIVDITDRPGADWDEEWADEVGDNYQRLVNRFERANRRLKDDTALKDIIAKTLPVLQSHWDVSKKLEDRLNKDES